MTETTAPATTPQPAPALAARPSSAASHVLTGAAIAAFVAAIWVIHYLVTTSYGSYYGGSSLLSIVLGEEHGIGADGAEALFVIGARFLLVSGLAWLPASAVVAAVRR